MLTMSPATMPWLVAPMRDGRLAGQDPGARLDSRAEARDGIDQFERGANRPFGVVLLRDRRSPDGHHRVADELLDRAAVALDHVARQVEVAGQRLADVLRVTLLGKRREADQVGEQDADEAPLGFDAPRPRCCGRHGRGVASRLRAVGRRAAAPTGERRRALLAELRGRRVDEAAVRAARRQWRGALHAELRAGHVLSRAVGTDHRRRRIARRSAHN